MVFQIVSKIKLDLNLACAAPTVKSATDIIKPAASQRMVSFYI